MYIGVFSVSCSQCEGRFASTDKENLNYVKIKCLTHSIAFN